MDWIQALILGIIQGLTEFLPISSSGHLIIGKELLGLTVTENIAFETVVHCATVLSTITVLRKEIAQLFLKFFKLKWNTETQYVCMLLFSMIPVMIVGFFFKDSVEKLFGQGLTLVGSMLLVTALLLAASSFMSSKRLLSKSNNGSKEFKTKGEPISWRSAFLIGMAQAVAVLPGLSRSGATIATGLFYGVRKDEVAKFSFLMVLIPILGETCLGALQGDFSSAVSGISSSSLIIGFFAAYFSGCLACKLMIELIKRTNLIWFAVYCAIAGLIALLFSVC